MSGLKLHLGCGNERWVGWVNVDLFEGPAVDMVCDIRDLATKFEPGSCSSIHLMHAINYLTLWEARAFFRTARALLAPGGDLVIETADAAKAAKRFLDAMGSDFDGYLEGIRPFPGFGLDHLQGQQRYMPNSMVWTPWHMTRELRDAGFDAVVEQEPKTHAKWRDFRVEARVAVSAPAVSSSAAGVRRVLFVVDEEAGHVTTHIRARMFVEPLARRGIQAAILDARRDPVGRILASAADADVVFMVKVPSLELLRAVKAHAKGPVLFDFTDALWLPHHAAYGWQNLHALLAEADALTCDNQVIGEYGTRHNDDVYLWPASTQVELMDAAGAALPPRVTDRPLRLGWVGSRGTATALAQIAGVLTAVAARVPGLELRLLGCEADVLPPITGLTVTARAQYDESAMIEELVQMDIGLFPAPQSLEDYRNRGPLKGLLYMSAALPMVCQRGGELDTIVRDGENGFCADGHDEWVERLVALATDASLRARVGTEARRSVEDRTLEAITDTLVRIFDAEVERKQSLGSANTANASTANGQPTMAAALDALQAAIASQRTDDARAIVSWLVQQDPDNVDFRALQAHLG